MFLRQVCKLFFMVEIFPLKIMLRGFPGGSVIENPPANAEDMEDPTCHGETKPLSHDY